MVVYNKANRVVREFRDSVTKQLLGTTKAKKRIVRNKIKILDFFLKNGEWPSRRSNNRTERHLGTIFENSVCKSNPGFDKNLRRISLVTGRTTNNKRKHNKAVFKQEILAFIKEHGHVPARYKHETVEGEGNLGAKLDYYVRINGDMSFLGEVYSLDRCHRSGIPMKFRAIINESLEVKKPLIRLI